MCALFIVMAYVRRTWQKKFTAAVLLLIDSLVVLVRSIMTIVGEDTNCSLPIIRASLIIQSITLNGAYWIFSKSLWDDSLRLQDLMGENSSSFFSSKGSRMAVEIVFWTLLFFEVLCNYVFYDEWQLRGWVLYFMVILVNLSVLLDALRRFNSSRSSIVQKSLPSHFMMKTLVALNILFYAAKIARFMTSYITFEK